MVYSLNKITQSNNFLKLSEDEYQYSEIKIKKRKGDTKEESG